MAGPVPVQLLYAWAAGEQEPAHADALLDPFRVEGTVVSSDTSGLSRLTEERDLLDVLALISEPKQILHAIAVAIGGRPIGTWVADNTQTYFPPSVDPPAVVAGMSEATHRIARELAIGVGICVHRGGFYELGGRLYGENADIVENIAENHAGPGDVLVTQAVLDCCPGELSFTPRDGLTAASQGAAVFALSGGPGMRLLHAPERRYPHPYPDEFFDRLMALKHADEPDRARRDIYDEYLKERVVVFIARSKAARGARTGAALLDELVANVLLDAVVSGLEGIRGRIAGMGGGLGILTFETSQEAIDAAQALRRLCAANGLVVKIGMASGPVLLFSNPRGPSGIAGSPVNVASKLSEDAGIPGRINIAGNVAAGLDGLDGADPFAVTVHGVVLRGLTV
jgi:class 3 adenylate cyclase